MARIFLDANILFSGSNVDGHTRRFLDSLVSNHILICSPFAIEEAQRNITNKKPDWANGINSLLSFVTTVPDALLLEDVVLVAKDRPILGAAVSSKCEYLITGDRWDFGHLYGKSIGGVMIVDTKMLLTILKS